MSTRTRAMKTNRKTQKKDLKKLVRIVSIAAIALAVIAILVLTLSSCIPSGSSAVQNGNTSDVEAQQGKTLTYKQAPAMQIDVSKTYRAKVTMEKGGEFVILLYADKAPLTVNNFVFLAREGYYSGVTFHRVLDGFMAQGGDPSGTGGGGPGYQFVNEDSDLTFDKAGVVAMANAGRDTNGSQFFITFGPQERLNGGYTIFGQVTEGMDVVNGLTRRNPDLSPDFLGDRIASITITEE